MTQSNAYRDAGVDIEAGENFAGMIRERVRRAWPGGEDVIGGFAGEVPVPVGVKRMAGSVDGTGTKAILAALSDIYYGIGIDAVAMAAQDMYIAGCQPMYALDVLNVSNLSPGTQIQIIESVIKGCQQAGCSLIGGETAELPDMFPVPWMFNLDVTVVGFSIERGSAVFDVRAGQKVIGWPSNGPASNGFSLIRKVFGLKGPDWEQAQENLMREYGALDNNPLAVHLLRPTPIWINQIEAQRLRGVIFSAHAHITGGGMPGNIPRVLPPGLKVVIERGSWKRPPIFRLIAEKGDIDQADMDVTFNQGIQVVSIADGCWAEVNDPEARVIGEVKEREGDEPQVELVGFYNG